MYWNYEPLFTAVNGPGEVCLQGGEGREGEDEVLLFINLRYFLMKYTSLYSPWNKLMIITHHRRYSSVYNMSMTVAREVVEWIQGCES